MNIDNIKILKKLPNEILYKIADVSYTYPQIKKMSDNENSLFGARQYTRIVPFEGPGLGYPTTRPLNAQELQEYKNSDLEIRNMYRNETFNNLFQAIHGRKY